MGALNFRALMGLLGATENSEPRGVSREPPGDSSEPPGGSGGAGKLPGAPGRLPGPHLFRNARFRNKMVSWPGIFHNGCSVLASREVPGGAGGHFQSKMFGFESRWCLGPTSRPRGWFPGPYFTTGTAFSPSQEAPVGTRGSTCKAKCTFSKHVGVLIQPLYWLPSLILIVAAL